MTRALLEKVQKKLKDGLYADTGKRADLIFESNGLEVLRLLILDGPNCFLDLL